MKKVEIIEIDNGYTVQFTFTSGSGGQKTYCVLAPIGKPHSEETIQKNKEAMEEVLARVVESLWDFEDGAFSGKITITRQGDQKR